MWGKKAKTIIAVAPPVVQVDTIQLVRETARCSVDVIPEISKREHEYKLQQLIGNDRTNPVGYFSEKYLGKLFDAGFYWVVGADFVKRFKYCAGIGRSGAVGTDLQLLNIREVSYIGDIPDASIARIKEAKEWFNFITVHSCEPMPVERGRQIDPVAIGWLDSPAILVKDSGEFVRCSDNCLGMVITIWDKEKELSVI